jgi:hypothetical protein
MYRLFRFENQYVSVTRLLDNTSIPFVVENTDYANFKADILADKATLQDADGNEMSAEQAKEFVLTLP